MARAYLGQGIKYPFEITQFGRIALQNDKELIRQSIRRILETTVGTVFFNRDFGSYIRELIFEPNDSILFSLLDFHVVEAVVKWEKRVESIETVIETNEQDSSRVDVRLTYRILPSNEIDSFIYPFYRELKN